MGRSATKGSGGYVAKFYGHTAALLTIKSTRKWCNPVGTAVTTGALTDHTAFNCSIKLSNKNDLEPENEGTLTLLDMHSEFIS
jgi:hypothetical protein